MFVNREQELAVLEDAWGSDKAEFIVVYGRRRVGKTALLQTFSESRSSIFWTASLSSDAILRRGITQELWQFTHEEGNGPGFTYESWEHAFRAIAEISSNQRLVVVIDEFPYLVNADASVSSVLQNVWDKDLQQTKLMLILCGSQIGMMEREVLAYRAPLYGRRTGQIHLAPLSFRATASFFERYSLKNQIEAYGILGGIPAYLNQFDDRDSLIKNIERQILRQGSFLYLEPQFLLREELREPRNYFAILQSIAHGRTKLNEIVQTAGLERQAVSRYLAVLQDLYLVERIVPGTERRPEKSRKGIYRIKDPFLRFWFRFVAPNQSVLERGYLKPVLDEVKSEFTAFMGPVFEEICRNWLMEHVGTSNLPFVPDRMGAWWDRNEEIDILAYNDDAALFGECKWTNRRVGTNILDDLMRKSLPIIESMGLQDVRYVLFSRSGYTPALEDRAKKEGVSLFGMNDMKSASITAQ